MGTAILHIRQTNRIWGPDRFILQLGTTLPAEGFEVEVAVLDNPGDPADSGNNMVLTARDAGIYVEHLRARWRDLPRLVAHLCYWVKHRSIKLIHTHEFKTQVLGAVIARLPGVPHVTSDHGELLGMRLWYHLGLWGARGSRRVVANSQHRISRLKQQGFRDTKIAYCPSGIDPTFLKSGAAVGRDLVRGAHQAFDDDFVILCPARLEPVKDQKTLVRALALVVAQHDRARLWLAGSGEARWRTELQVLVAELGLSERVLFLDYQRNMAELFLACDLVVLPSIDENFPLALLEASVAARPVVATAVGGVPELVEDGVTGWLVAPASPTAMAQAILAAARDPVSAALRGQAGRCRVDAFFSARRSSGRMAEIYRGVQHESV